MNEYCAKIQCLIYGDDIRYPIILDELLNQASSKKQIHFSPAGIGLTEPEKHKWECISKLIQDGYISGVADSSYAITHQGKLFLSHGGYTAEAKKSKNALFAFRLSVVSLLVAVISFIVSLTR
jgi:hypothetical protein